MSDSEDEHKEHDRRFVKKVGNKSSTGTSRIIDAFYDTRQQRLELEKREEKLKKELIKRIKESGNKSLCSSKHRVTLGNYTRKIIDTKSMPYHLKQQYEMEVKYQRLNAAKKSKKEPCAPNKKRDPVK